MAEDSARNLIWKHRREIRSCMMVTQAGDRLRGRPMGFIAISEQILMWFSAESDLAKEYDANTQSKVCLIYADMQLDFFVSVSGTVSRVFGVNTINDLWNPGADMFLRKSSEDIEVVLLRFDPMVGDYWNARETRLARAISFLTSRMTGCGPHRGNCGWAILAPAESYGHFLSTGRFTGYGDVRAALRPSPGGYPEIPPAGPPRPLEPDLVPPPDIVPPEEPRPPVEVPPVDPPDNSPPLRAAGGGSGRKVHVRKSGGWRIARDFMGSA